MSTGASSASDARVRRMRRFKQAAFVALCCAREHGVFCIVSRRHGRGAVANDEVALPTAAHDSRIESCMRSFTRTSITACAIQEASDASAALVNYRFTNGAGVF